MSLRALSLLLLTTGCVTDVLLNEGKPTPSDTGDAPPVDRDGDGIPAAEGDCDDERADVYPGHSEACDEVDNNCDGQIDEGVTTTYYDDVDADTYGDDAAPVEACALPEGAAERGGDCDDEDPAINPGALEVCDERDNDCDALIDEDVLLTFYEDADGDFYGDPAAPVEACAAPDGTVDDDTDCDDTDITIHPDAPESCTEPIDANCDGSLSWADDDSDGTPACLDCDDNNAEAHPGAAEVCNSIDDDCDTLTDDADPDVDLTTGQYTWADADVDTYGDPLTGQWTCAVAAGRVYNDDDCDDSTAAISPAAQEVCNSIDDDCDTLIDDDDPSADLTTGVYSWEDADLDGYGDPLTGAYACITPAGDVSNDDDCDDTAIAVYPGAPELCNGIDDDCDGTIADEVCTNNCSINFSSAYTAYGNGGNPTSAYGAYGLTFTMGSGYGLIGGDAYGDPGNWSDVNTVPNPAWGLWDFGSNVNNLSFSSSVSNVSFTLERTAGGSDITVTVNAYLSGSLVGSSSLRLTGSTSVQTMTLPWTLDRIEHMLTAGNGFAYAIDDLKYSTAGTCPP